MGSSQVGCLGLVVLSAEEELAWEAEIERRLAAHDGGDVTAIDWRDAVERAREALRGDNA
jgi:hypothetical protein